MTRLEEEYKTRKNKLNKAREAGYDPYPARVKRSHTISHALANFKEISVKNKATALVGRLKTIRLHGGSCFAHIEDGTAAVQVYFKKDRLGEKSYQDLKDLLDVGDFIEVNGTFFNTKKGEKTLLVHNFKLISKSLLPLPEKWHGLSDIEIRYRKRYLDLISNPSIKKIFQKRSILIKTIRDFLNEAGFLEVDTPTLQSIPGGANARPFKTHHQALDIDLYLRIAPELYLKRLIIGGFEKVFEIAKCFRNEGIDKNHNPEFTQVEFYAAYWDYKQLMNFTEKLISKIVREVNKNLVVNYDNKDINFTPPFKKITFQKASEQFAKIDIAKINQNNLIKQIKDLGLEISKPITKAKVLDEIFKELIRPKLINPTFIIDYPIELSPLAKKKEDNPNIVERFQLVAGGRELGNAFSELNDPLDQEQRFLYQEKMRKTGDEEAQRIDKDFLEALSHGMPPTAGIGLGIDRLTLLLTNTHNIKEVILFPTLKPKE